VLASCSLRENRIETALDEAAGALRFFQESNDTVGCISAIDIMSMVHWLRGKYSDALESMQTALQLAEQEQVGNRRLSGKIMGNIGLLLFTLGDYPQALRYQQRGLAIAEQQGNYKSMYITLTNIGNTHVQLGNISQALEHFFRALALAEQYNDDNDRATGKVMTQIGNVFRLLGEYDRALEYLLCSLDSIEKADAPLELGTLLLNIGMLYHDKKEYEAARSYIMRALGIHDGINGVHHLMVRCKSTLASMELQLGNSELALKLALDALHICEAIEYSQEKGHALALIAVIYKHRKAYDAAMEYFHRSLLLCQEKNNLAGQCDALIGIGTTLSCLQCCEQAVGQLQSALQTAEQSGYKSLLPSIHQALAEAYEGMGSTACALRHYKLFHDIDKEIFNEKADQRIQTLNVLYQVEEIRREAQTYKKENAQLQQNIECVRKDLVIQALYLAEQTNLVQQAREKLSGLLTGTFPEIREEICRSVGELFYPLPTAENATAKELKSTHVSGKSVAVEEKVHSIRNDVRTVVQMLERALVDDGRWRVFEQQFGQVHRGFTETVAKRFPQLSTAEQKVCALLKINMSSKEIGCVLNISSKSVDTYRYNIRRKIGLHAGVSLTQFLTDL